jgi:hypothetical protein
MSSASLPASADRQALLRQLVLADGLVSGVTGVALALAAGPLNDLLGLPTMLLRVAGLSLLPYAAALLYLGTRTTISRSGAWAVVGLNLIWAAASMLLLLTGWVDPTGVGIAFVLGQALIVVAVADVQYLALRRAA